jgi:hypothetical protein
MIGENLQMSLLITSPENCGSKKCGIRDKGVAETNKTQPKCRTIHSVSEEFSSEKPSWRQRGLEANMQCLIFRAFVHSDL